MHEHYFHFNLLCKNSFFNISEAMFIPLGFLSKYIWLFPITHRSWAILSFLFSMKDFVKSKIVKHNLHIDSCIIFYMEVSIWKKNTSMQLLCGLHCTSKTSRLKNSLWKLKVKCASNHMHPRCNMVVIFSYM